MSTYHHGQIIKKYREKCGLTQAGLAEKWPRSDGEVGCSNNYIHMVETGKKIILDNAILRKLSDMLDIPLHEFGLSEYDPFQPANLPGYGRRMFDETLDSVEFLVRQIWSLRCAARIVDAERGVKHLQSLFKYFHNQLPPPMRLENRFQLLEVQVQRLQAATLLENKHYDDAVAVYMQMCRTSKHLDNAAVTAVALKSLGKELERKGKKDEAVSLLEEARDASLGASKLVIAFVHSYLSRIYASVGDSLHFERAVNTGLTVAHSIKDIHEHEKTDYVYSWSPISSMLAEQSWGYLNVGEPKKTLAMREEIEQAIEQGQDARVYAWIPLDWARAYYMLGEVEEGVKEAREFMRRVSAMKSPHAISQSCKYIKELENTGYGELSIVKEFRDELSEMKGV